MRKAKGYAWKSTQSESAYHATAEQAHAAFETIRKRDGKLTAPAVVDEARPEESVLHEDFEWRDDIAAEKYRQQQARQMISAVRIVWEEKSPPVRAYVNVRLVEQEALNAADAMHPAEEPTAKEPPARCYMPLEEVLEQPQLRTQMLEDARRDAQNYKQKYSTLASLASIMQAIDQTFERKEVGKA
jgi:quinol monooxygenase YgiN